MPNTIKVGIEATLVGLQKQVEIFQSAFRNAEIIPEKSRESLKELESVASRLSKLLQPGALEVANPTELKKTTKEILDISKSISGVTNNFKQMAALGPEAFSALTSENLFKNIKDMEKELSSFEDSWKNIIALNDKLNQKTKERNNLQKASKTIRETGAKQTTIDDTTYFKKGRKGKEDSYLTDEAKAIKQAYEDAKAARDKFIAEAKNNRGQNFFDENGNQIAGGKGLKDAQAQLESLNNTLEETKSKADKIVIINSDDYKAQLTNVKAEIKSTQEEIAQATQSTIESFKSSFQNATGVELFGSTYEEVFNNATKAIETNTNAFNAQREVVQKAADEEDKFKEKSKELEKGINDASDSMLQLTSVEREVSQVTSRLMSYFSISAVINTFKKSINEAVQAVKELDASMTEIAVVSKYDISDIWGTLPEFTKIAKELGVAINDVYQATTLYIQQGLNLNNSMELATETMKMARIAGIDAANATQAMTSALRGFNLELNNTSAQRVNDVYSELAKITAADTQQIATAMTKVASLADSAGMSLENTAAFLAQIIETTQESAETAGTALKTVVARFSEVKTLFNEGQLTGTDSEGESIEINKIDAALKTVGLSLNKFLLGQEGLDDVLTQLAAKWDTLDVATQRY